MKFKISKHKAGLYLRKEFKHQFNTCLYDLLFSKDLDINTSSLQDVLSIESWSSSELMHVELVINCNC